MEQNTEKPAENKVQTGLFCPQPSNPNCSDFNLTSLLGRRGERVPPVCGPAQEQRSMLFCHSSNRTHLSDLAFAKKASSQVSIFTKEGYLIYFDYILFKMCILLF